MEQKKLSLLDAVMLVSGSMIGSGIFIVSVFMSRDVGSSGWLLFLWLLTGFITITAALSYGELAGMMPKAGGQYVYLKRAFGSFVAFLYGWTVFTVIQTGVIAAVAVAFAKYTAVFFPSLQLEVFEGFGLTITRAQLVAIGLIVFLTWINSRGIQSGKIIQLVFTSSKLLALLVLIVLGIAMAFKTDVLSQNFTNMWAASTTRLVDGKLVIEQIAGMALLGALGATIINSLFSSDAWNNVTFIAGEIENPGKNIPRSLVIGTVLVTILYILANVAYMALLPLKGNPEATDVFGQGMQFAANDRVGTAAASVIFGDIAIVLMAALIMISTFGCNNGIILAGGRLFQAMALDGLFFKKAASLNSKNVPALALWIQGLWASVLCLSGKYSDLLTYATFASLLFYILTIAGLFVLRRKEANTPRPYKAWGYPVIPALYIFITVAICVDLLIYDSRNTQMGLLIVAFGIPVYYLWKWNSRRTTTGE